jgi:hypothetical protein
MGSPSALVGNDLSFLHGLIRQEAGMSIMTKGHDPGL